MKRIAGIFATIVRRGGDQMTDCKFESIAAAVEYIESHLDEKVDLKLVADAVHYSKYHLHRIFSGTVGLTIHNYTQRRRLTEAAKLLAFSEKPIMEIALEAGYESQQAFTGAFTAMYKQPPRRYREGKRFYPLQLPFHPGENRTVPRGATAWEIAYALEKDIPCWMELVRQVIGGFPHLYEEEYLPVLREQIRRRQALILKDGASAAGILLFSREMNTIGFFGVHPFYRNLGVPEALLDRVLAELGRDCEVSITTYREGDRADTGQRRAIMALGFAEAEMLVEYGYPTQRFVLKRGGVFGGESPADGSSSAH